MKYELGGKTMTKILKSKTQSYLTDDSNENKKEKHTKSV